MVGTCYLEIAPSALLFRSHCLPFLHVFTHPLPFGLPIIQFLLLLLLLDPLTLQDIFLLLFLLGLFLLSFAIHVLENHLPFILKLCLPFCLCILIMALHFIFIFFDFLHIIIILVVLVWLIVTFNHKVAFATIVIAVIARLLLYHPFLLFTNKLILPNKRWRLFLDIGSSIAKFNLINFGKYILGSPVYT